MSHRIYKAIRFGALLENVVFDPETRAIDYSDASKTENTRVSYPLEHIDNTLAMQPAHGNKIPKQGFMFVKRNHKKSHEPYRRSRKR